MTGTTRTANPWQGFKGTTWRHSLDVAGFIRDDYTPYAGDGTFLTGPTARTMQVWSRLSEMFAEERRRGVYDIDARTPSTITAQRPGLPRPGA
jgi:formate C-acetyltransferase